MEIIIAIWILLALLIIIILELNLRPVSPPTYRIIVDLDNINIPMYGSFRFPQPIWVTEMMNGTVTDFGIYKVEIKRDRITLLSNATIFVNTKITNVTAYSVEFDNKVILYRGSPFIKIKNVKYTGDWYRNGNYIWLKSGLPEWYGKITPLILPEHIDVSDNNIQITWKENIYYWIPAKLIDYWKGNIIYEGDKFLGFGNKIVIPYIPAQYNSVDNLFLDLFDQDLQYNANIGQITPINKVVELVKESIYIGMPKNQAQMSRLNLLFKSIVNTNSKFFSILPIIDLYLIQSSDKLISIEELLGLVGYIHKCLLHEQDY